jgi:hypothetical protein
MCISRQPRIVLILLVAFLTGGVGWPASDSRADAPKPKIVLPKDPKAVVLSYDPGNGGFVRKGPPPYLQVRADGQVTVVSPFDGSRKERKLTAKELDDLLRFILHDKDFFNLTAAKITDGINKEAAATGKFIAIGGAGIAVIEVHANGKDHEVKFRGASAYLATYPKVEVLAKFAAIESRLSGLGAAVAKGK